MAQDRLYPLDVDRAFRVLDGIKSAVREFWIDGATPGLLLQRRQVVASSVWHGRPNQLIKQGAPLAYQWNGAGLLRRDRPMGRRGLVTAVPRVGYALDRRPYRGAQNAV